MRRLLVLLTVASLATSCGATADGANLESVPYRLIAEDVAEGEPYTARRVTDTSDASPGVGAFDYDDPPSEVFFEWVLAESSSCPFGSLDRLEFDRTTRLLYPVVQEASSNGDCTADANPHLVFVAVRPQDLPTGAFAISVGAEGWPNDFEPIAFADGELTRPNAETTTEGAGDRGAVSTSEPETVESTRASLGGGPTAEDALRVSPCDPNEESDRAPLAPTYAKVANWWLVTAADDGALALLEAEDGTGSLSGSPVAVAAEGIAGEDALNGDPIEEIWWEIWHAGAVRVGLTRDADVLVGTNEYGLAVITMLRFDEGTTMFGGNCGNEQHMRLLSGVSGEAVEAMTQHVGQDLIDHLGFE